MKKIEISIGSIVLLIECFDTPTAERIINAQPFQSTAQTWGREIYFSTPVTTEIESNAKDVINAGEIAFWVEGKCIAIGYGPTPISEGNEIRLAAKTNIWGHTDSDLGCLTNVHSGDIVSLRLFD